MTPDGMSTSAPPGDRRSPAAGARWVLRRLDELWNEWAEAGGDTAKDFVTLVIAPQMRADDTMTGLRWANEIEQLKKSNAPVEERGLAIGWYLWAACGYAVDALRAHESGRVIDAWCAAGDARYWLGVTAGTWNVQKNDPEQAKLFGQMAVSASQSQRASKARPKTKPTHRSITIAAMRQARAEGKTLDAFLAAAANDAIDGLSIKPVDDVKDVERWKVWADEFDDPKKMSRPGLADWWRAAASKK